LKLGSFCFHIKNQTSKIKIAESPAAMSFLFRTELSKSQHKYWRASPPAAGKSPYKGALMHKFVEKVVVFAGRNAVSCCGGMG